MKKLIIVLAVLLFVAAFSIFSHAYSRPKPEEYERFYELLRIDQDSAGKYAECILENNGGYSVADSAVYNVSDTSLCGILIQAGRYLAYTKCQFSKAVECEMSALEVYGLIGGYESEMAWSKSRLAEYYYKIGKYHMALQYATEAYMYFKMHEDIKGLMKSSNILGAANLVCEDFDEAGRYFRFVRNAAENIGDSIMLASVLTNMSVAYSIVGNNDSAAVCDKMVLNIYSTLKDTSRLYDTYWRLASARINSAEYDEAEACLDKCRPYIKSLNDSVRYFHCRGLLDFAAGNIDGSERNLRKALELYERCEFPMLMAHCINALYYIYSHTGNDAAAYDILKLYYSSQSERQDKDVLIELFNTKNEILQARHRAKEELDRHRTNMMILTVSFLIFIAALVFVYILIRKNDRIRRGEHEVKVRNEVLEMKEIQEHQLEVLTNVVSNRLDNLARDLKDDRIKPRIENIKQEISAVKCDTVVKNLSLLHSEYYSDYLKKLLEVHPGLSVNERRLCVLLNQNLSSKEVSRITQQSIDSINKARIRLRHKLGITGQDISIQEYLSRFK